MTVDTYINWEIPRVNKRIAELEALLDKEQDAVKKKEYERLIKRDKGYLEYLKNLPPEEKAEIAKSLENFKKAVKAFEPHAKVGYTFNHTFSCSSETTALGYVIIFNSIPRLSR